MKVTDSMVEAACIAADGEGHWTRTTESYRAATRTTMRRALEAAFIHLDTGAVGGPGCYGELRPMNTAPKSGVEVVLKVKVRAGVPGKYLVGHHMASGYCIEDHPPIEGGWYFWNGCSFDRAAEPLGWFPIPPEWPRTVQSGTLEQTLLNAARYSAIRMCRIEDDKFLHDEDYTELKMGAELDIAADELVKRLESKKENNNVT